MIMAYACRYNGPTSAISNRTSWGPATSPHEFPPKICGRPLSGNYDRIFNAFERTNAFEYVRSTFEERTEEDRVTGHADIVVNRKMSSSFERADCSLAAQTPCSDDDDYYQEKILYSQARQLFPLQEDLADWINKSIDITYLNGENFLDVLDNGVELCQLAAVIHGRAKEAFDQGLIVGPVPQIRGRCWQRAARRSFFSRDNTENFITFCRELGVHENLLFESDDLVLHNQPRQVILCLLEVARLASRLGLEPPGLVQLESEIALEERDAALHNASSGWQFRPTSPENQDTLNTDLPATPDATDGQLSLPDNIDNESTKSEGTVGSTDSDVPLKPTNELDKRVQLVTRLMDRGCNCTSAKCSKLLKVKKVGEGRYNIAGRNVFIRLLKGRHMMVRVGGGWDTLEHFLSRHEPCQVLLVTHGRASLLAPHPPPAPHPPEASPGRTSPKTPSGKSTPDKPNGKLSPDSSRLSTKSSGKISPASSNGHSSPPSGKTSPLPRGTSTPKPRPRSALSLPLKQDPPRKQSAPSFSTPSTPNGKTDRKIPTPKKSRSMSLALQKDNKPFCGTDKLNQAKKASVGIKDARKTRSQSLASTPVTENKKFCGTDKLNEYAKKTRSMSLASPVSIRPISKAISVNGAMTQAAIEESIRLSLAASIGDVESAKKTFLHIKAKYRSPPPREVPPR